MDMPATSRKRPASSPLNAEARQPTTSIGSISPPRVLRSAPTSPSPVPTRCHGEVDNTKCCGFLEEQHDRYSVNQLKDIEVTCIISDDRRRSVSRPTRTRRRPANELEASGSVCARLRQNLNSSFFFFQMPTLRIPTRVTTVQDKSSGDAHHGVLNVRKLPI